MIVSSGILVLALTTAQARAVQVVDPEGRPCLEARSVYSQSWDALLAGRGEHFVADSAGRLSMPPAPGWLLVSAPGGASSCLDPGDAIWDANAGSNSLSLAPTVQFVLRVTDHGQPLANATARAYLPLGRETEARSDSSPEELRALFHPSAVTDAEGRAELRLVAGLEYEFDVLADGFVPKTFHERAESRGGRPHESVVKLSAMLLGGVILVDPSGAREFSRWGGHSFTPGNLDKQGVESGAGTAWSEFQRAAEGLERRLDLPGPVEWFFAREGRAQPEPPVLDVNMHFSPFAGGGPVRVSYHRPSEMSAEDFTRVDLPDRGPLAAIELQFDRPLRPSLSDSNFVLRGASAGAPLYASSSPASAGIHFSSLFRVPAGRYFVERSYFEGIAPTYQRIDEVRLESGIDSALKVELPDLPEVEGLQVIVEDEFGRSIRHVALGLSNNSTSRTIPASHQWQVGEGERALDLWSGHVTVSVYAFGFERCRTQCEITPGETLHLPVVLERADR